MSPALGPFLSATYPGLRLYLDWAEEFFFNAKQYRLLSNYSASYNSIKYLLYLI
jgi:hypothetical protein